MPRKYGGKKPRKMTVKKAQAVVAKVHKSKAKKNMDTYFLKTTTTMTLTPAQGVLTSNYVYNCATLDPKAGYSYYINNAEFQLWRLQYDKYRVNSVTYKVIPKANVLDQANGANNDGSFNVIGDGLVHTCIDRDGVAPSSRSLISRYPSYKKFSILKPFSRTYSIKYPTGVWLDCDAPTDFTMSKELGLTGGVTIYAENVLEDNAEVFNEPWATVTVQYNIVFQGKTSNSLSGVYGDNGELLGVTINKIKESDLLAITPLANFAGSLNQDTITQNEIVELPVNDLGQTV